MKGKITISLEDYEALCALQKKNEELQGTLHELETSDDSKGFIHEVIIVRHLLGDSLVKDTWDVVGIEDMKERVKSFYKANIDEARERALKAELEVSRLKHRNLWQRILNK